MEAVNNNLEAKRQALNHMNWEIIRAESYCREMSALPECLSELKHFQQQVLIQVKAKLDKMKKEREQLHMEAYAESSH